ncbi:MAG: hypothetical protein EOP06_00410 [Proteobacteria bacterium]|nr:MAG: hypothetical protein EOP06_00410 [Pseudomonadota bacterium]
MADVIATKCVGHLDLDLLRTLVLAGEDPQQAYSSVTTEITDEDYRADPSVLNQRDVYTVTRNGTTYEVASADAYGIQARAHLADLAGVLEAEQPSATPSTI